MRESIWWSVSESSVPDVVYDPVGGDYFDIARRLVAWEGRLLVVGFDDLPRALKDLFDRKTTGRVVFDPRV